MHSEPENALVWREVIFRPWIGAEYRSTTHWGCRLLVLGDSHYREFPSFPQHLYTRYVIRAHLRGEASHRFWTEVGRVVTGQSRFTPETRRAFWRSIAFYNYIQEFVGPGPSNRPSRSAWSQAG